MISELPIRDTSMGGVAKLSLESPLSANRDVTIKLASNWGNATPHVAQMSIGIEDIPLLIATLDAHYKVYQSKLQNRSAF